LVYSGSLWNIGDCLVHSLASESPMNTNIEDIMTREDKIFYVSPWRSSLYIMERMVHHKIRHVPVVSRGEVVRIISIKDVIERNYRLNLMFVD